MSKLPTGIVGFDHIALGGLPVRRTTLVAGSTGSGKTLFGLEFLMKGILQFDEPGVFVTFEESPSDLRQIMASFGYDIDGTEAAGKWMFIDAALKSSPPDAVIGNYDSVASSRASTKRCGVSGLSELPSTRPGHSLAGSLKRPTCGSSCTACPRRSKTWGPPPS